VRRALIKFFVVGGLLIEASEVAHTSLTVCTRVWLPAGFLGKLGSQVSTWKLVAGGLQCCVVFSLILLPPQLREVVLKFKLVSSQSALRSFSKRPQN
jgi:hypothetical protein